MKPLTRPVTATSTKNKNEPYRQCRLRKGDRIVVSYIPKKFAIQGQTVKLRRDQQCDDGWRVEETWGEVDESFLDGIRNALKHHAEVSDI